MKTFIALLSLITLNANASISMGLVKFGSIGPSLESLPKPSSIKEAKELFDTIQRAQIGTIKIVDSRDGIMKCGNFSTPLKAAFACEMLIKMDTAKVVVAQANAGSTNVTFSGDMARQLYDSMLTLTSTVRIGATTKKAGNLSCVKGVNLNRTVSCTFKGVRFYEMNE